MLKGKNRYAEDMVFPVTAMSTDKSVGLEGRCELTQVNVQYINIARKVLVDQRKKCERERS